MIIDLGLIDYEAAYKIQKEFVARRKLGEVEDTVIFAEHPSIFTIGRRGSIENLLSVSSDIKVLRVDRGGNITYHGPGQLVIYPIIDLKSAGQDLHAYLRRLEDVVIGFLAGYGIDAGTAAGRTGVWAGAAKIASIGIGASGWVTYHGIGLNVKTEMEPFLRIRPCGMDIEMTSMEIILGRAVSMEDVKNEISNEFTKRAGAANLA